MASNELLQAGTGTNRLMIGFALAVLAGAIVVIVLGYVPTNNNSAIQTAIGNFTNVLTTFFSNVANIVILVILLIALIPLINKIFQHYSGGGATLG